MMVAGLLPERGDCMTLLEVIALLMLLIAVIKLVIYLTKKK
jgi:hypothetical protein